MLTLVLAESSIERVPKRLHKHPSVIAHALRRRKSPRSLILDRSYHHSAMRLSYDKDVSEAWGKHGRPDIAFHCLLQALGSPLNRECLLKICVHTIEDKVIEVNPSARLPRNYDRFIGVLEQLYENRQVPTRQRPLMSMCESTLPELHRRLNPSTTVAFSTKGKLTSMKNACSEIMGTARPAVIIGGFAHSHFKQSTLKLANQIFSVDREALDAWIVAGRLIYEYECLLGISEKRIRMCTGRAFESVDI